LLVEVLSGGDGTRFLQGKYSAAVDGCHREVARSLLANSHGLSVVAGVFTFMNIVPFSGQSLAHLKEHFQQDIV
jgi:hypothetical protein